MRKLDGVRKSYRVTGSDRLMLEAVVRSIADLDAILGHLASRFRNKFSVPSEVAAYLKRRFANDGCAFRKPYTGCVSWPMRKAREQET